MAENELMVKAATLVAEARTIQDKADEDNKRALTDEESTRLNKLVEEGIQVREEADKVQRDKDNRKRLDELDEYLRESDGTRAGRQDVDGRSDGDPGKAVRETKEQKEKRSAFDHYLREGRQELSEAENRALQADDGVQGGYLVAPQQFIRDLIAGIDDDVFIRRLANVRQLTGAESLGVPTRDGDVDDADWTAEIGSVTEDTGLNYGKRELWPHLASKLVKVSMKLLRISAISAEQEVMERLRYKFGITHEKGFLTGSGAQQPLGVFTASNDGISTSRDVSTGNSTTAPTFDGLIEAKFSLKGQYWNRAWWVFHRDVLKIIAKLKDGEGQYLWRQSVRSGEPDRILDRPIAMSEYAPNTLTTGLYVGILGDFKSYWIVDFLGFQVQRLNEKYADTNQIGFIGRMESDGMPVLEEAFARVTLA